MRFGSSSILGKIGANGQGIRYERSEPPTYLCLDVRDRDLSKSFVEASLTARNSTWNVDAWNWLLKELPQAFH